MTNQNQDTTAAMKALSSENADALFGLPLPVVVEAAKAIESDNGGSWLTESVIKQYG